MVKMKQYISTCMPWLTKIAPGKIPNTQERFKNKCPVHLMLPVSRSPWSLDDKVKTDTITTGRGKEVKKIKT